MACSEFMIVLCAQDEQDSVVHPSSSCRLHFHTTHGAWLACGQGCMHGGVPGSAQQ